MNASKARKQEGRSRLIRPSSWKSFFDGSYGILRLTLGEYCLDRLSSGEQTGRACRKSAAVIASQSCWQQDQHGSNLREKASSQCSNRLARQVPSGQNAIETDNGVFVESFGTLAFPDSYHASHGYSASSVMTQITFHRDGGEALRHIYKIRDSRKVPDLTL